MLLTFKQIENVNYDTYRDIKKYIILFNILSGVSILQHCTENVGLIVSAINLNEVN